MNNNPQMFNRPFKPQKFQVLNKLIQKSFNRFPPQQYFNLNKFRDPRAFNKKFVPDSDEDIPMNQPIVIPEVSDSSSDSVTESDLENYLM